MLVVMTVLNIPISFAQTSTDQQGSNVAVKDSVLDEKQIKRGRAKAQNCTRCHGRSGFASLAKASAWNGPTGLFISNQLKKLRDGNIYHAVMTDVARSLSDDDIDDISAWVQSLENE